MGGASTVSPAKLWNFAGHFAWTGADMVAVGELALAAHTTNSTLLKTWSKFWTYLLSAAFNREQFVRTQWVVRLL